MKPTVKHLVIKQNHIHLTDKIVFGQPLWLHTILYYYHHHNYKHFYVYGSSKFIEIIKSSLLNKKYPFISLSFETDLSRVPNQATAMNQLFINEKSYFIENDLDLMKFKKDFSEDIRLKCPGLIARNINKKLSIKLSLFLARYKISPNIITAFGLFLSFIGFIFCFFESTFWFAFLFFQLNSIVDGCDGEVARMNFQMSDFGKKFDVFSDYITSFLIFSGVALSPLSSNQPYIFKMNLINLNLLLIVALFWLIASKFYFKEKSLDNIEVVCHQKIRARKNFVDKTAFFVLWIAQRDTYIFILFILSFLFQIKYISLFLGVVVSGFLILSTYTFFFLKDQKITQS